MGTCSSMRRRMMMSGGEQESILPAGYTRLKYIYTTNNAYINTGVAIGSSDDISCAWLYVSSDGGDKCIWGARDTNALYSFVDKYGTSSSVYYRWGGKDLSNYVPSNRARVVDNIFYIYNGENLVQTWETGAGTFQMTTPLTLFAYNDKVQNTVRMNLKGVGIKEFTIAGKFDAIPCKDPNNVVGMYDIVNNVFHGSENSTAFIAGPNY